MSPVAATTLFTEFLSRMDRGETPDFEELLRDHPEQAGELRGLFLAECERLEASNQARGLSDPASLSGDLASEIVRRLSRRTEGFTRYSLGDEIGKGGMGSVRRVWDGDLQRDLAMKVARDETSDFTNSSTAARLLRFLREAQVTSRLDHPGVVPVHELGLDPTGRIYFTMKLVKGKTFAEVLALVHSGAAGWTRTRALGVIQRVCEAMAYAHDKGVLHRDLKPANVMVGEFGEVYVMDWGLARGITALNAEDDVLDAGAMPDDSASIGSRASPAHTREGQIMGTPAYMPPEQAEGRLAECGPHSDVYAVGAILYHLLAGRPPHTHSSIESESSPARRETTRRAPASLPRTTPVELAAICDKAMSLDWRERYRDMADMSADLSAFIEGRVVRAHETGALAETRKWVRRNRGLAGSLAAVLIVLVVGLLVSLELKARADEHSAQAEKIASFLEQTLSGVKPSVALGRDTTMLGEIMDAAWLRVESGELATAPEAELRVNWLIGDALRELERFDRAESVLRRAVERGRALGTAGKRHLRWSLSSLGLVLMELGDLPNAQVAAREALALSQSQFPGDHLDVATRLGNLASVLFASGELDEAEALWRDALAMCERLGTGDSEAIAEFSMGLAVALAQRGERTEALRLARSALKSLEALFPPPHPSVATALSNVAALLDRTTERNEAEELARRALDMRRTLFRGDSSDLAQSLAGLGSMLHSRRRLDEAEPLLREALAMRRHLHPGDHALVAESLNAIGTLLRDKRDHAAAEDIFREALAMRLRLTPGDSVTVAIALNNLGMTLVQRDDPIEAQTLLRDALEMFERVLPANDPILASANVNIGQLLESQGDFANAETRLRTARSIALAALPASHRTSVRAGTSLGSVLLARMEFEPAEQVLLEVESVTRDAESVDPADRRRCLELLVKTYEAWGQSKPGAGYDAKADTWSKELGVKSGR